MKLRFPAILFYGAFGCALAFSLACEKSAGDRILETDVRHYPSGAVQWKRTYVHGVKDGVHEGWWENGKKRFEYHFSMGAYDGDVKEWYPDGARALHLHYRNGVQTGLQQAWRENGTVYANFEVRDGRQYGIVNARLCYTVKDGEGVFHAPR